MHMKRAGAGLRIFLFLLLLQFYTASVFAGNDSWISVKTPRFSVLSQLNEKKTKKWAEEFDKFVSALHILYKADDNNLLPLTIVLFKNKKAFSPYSVRTESGQAKRVLGLFADMESYSIIGLPGFRSFNNIKRILYHEAVHWYINSNNFEPPLWLEEGLAECFSTFEVKKDIGIWGLPIQNHIDYLNVKDGLPIEDHIDYLNIKGLQPTERFLRTSQDEALHDEITFYPQAWAMVHFLMFGEGGKYRGNFSTFLSEMKNSSMTEAFQTGFGMTYSEFDKKLANYIRSGTYSFIQIDLKKIKTEMEVEPASDVMVQLALGRLAVSGGLFYKGVRHAEKIISAMPSRPEGYELLAMAYDTSGNRYRQVDALEKAISLNSRDPHIYLMKASMIGAENRKGDQEPIFNLWESGIAEEIADLYRKAILLRTTSEYVLDGYVAALFNVDKYKEDDRKLLELAMRSYPENGSVRVGLAILDKIDGDINSFNKRIAEALDESMYLSEHFKLILPRYQRLVYEDWLSDLIKPMIRERKFEQAEALMEEQKALPYASLLANVLDDMDSEILRSKRMVTAENLMKERKYNEAEAILNEIQEDKKADISDRRAVQDMLLRLERMKK